MRRKANQKGDKAQRDTCCVCLKAVQDGKDDALLCKGQCQKWLHCYCAGVTADQYEKLSSSQQPFFCFTCGRTQHQQEVAELRSEVEALRVELSQLRDAVSLLQRQPSDEPGGRKSDSEKTNSDGEWRHVEKKRRRGNRRGNQCGNCPRCSESVDQGAAETERPPPQHQPKPQPEKVKQRWHSVRTLTVNHTSIPNSNISPGGRAWCNNGDRIQASC